LSKQTKLSEETNKQLDEIKQVREAKGDPVKAKQNIVAQLVARQHKRECK